MLLGAHFIGQQALSFYCMKDAPTPDINDTLCLSITGSGYAPNEQYMRVRSILSRSSQTFWDDQGAFERDVIIVETVSALLYDFPGQEVNRRTSVKPATRVLQTNVVEATSYYSVKRLAVAAQPGDLSVKVATPYVNIVPATTAETPVVDVLAGQGTVSYVQAGATDSVGLTFNSVFAAGVGVTRFLGSTLLNGAVKVTVGSVVLADDGSGRLFATGVSPWSGSVDYQAGSVTVANDTGAGNTAVTIAATPAGAIVDQGYTDRIAIEPGNQGFNYIFQCVPLPAPGTVYVDYRALGRWIRLTDNGTGQLVGNPGQGSGTVNYATGSVVLTAGALPDLGSVVILCWGTGAVGENRSGDTAIKIPELNFMLPDTGIRPGSYVGGLTVGGAPVAVSDNRTGGLLVAGVQRGTIVYATGEVSLRLTSLPDGDTVLSNSYEVAGSGSSDQQPVPDSNGIASFTLPAAPLRAGSLRLSWLVSAQPMNEDLGTVTVAVRIEARDDGAGNIVAVSANGRALTGTLGTVNYTTGAVNCKFGKISIKDFPIPVYAASSVGGALRFKSRARADIITSFSAGTIVGVEFQDTSTPVIAESVPLPLPPVVLELTPTVLDSVIPGSVRFTFRGRNYVDRNGALYYGVDPVTGSGTYAGVIDYAAGECNIVQWAAGGTNSVSVESLATRIFDAGTDAVFFRAPGSPLRPGSFTLRSTTLGGEVVTAVADINGVLTGPLISGQVDWESGTASVRFGDMVPVAGNEGESWFDPANVVGTDVWRPHLMMAGSIYMGTVVYRSIPLSSVVIGLDPVRLPSDGRVPAFKAGQTVLVHHTAVHSVAAPAAGQVISFGRTRVAQVEVRDSAGTPVNSSWYQMDLDAGTLQFSDPLNLSAYVLPIVVRERVEDRRLCVQPQITGEIELNTGLTHDYPEGEAMISTALRLGEANGSLDLQARVESLFDQATWSNTWSDFPVGSVAPGTYNDTDYPLVVSNADAITERWAIRFTSASNFEVIGEAVGVIAVGSISADCAPLNPRTGLPYFTILRDGWGSGWAVNNAVRFNTIGGLAPVWMVRTTLPGTAATAVDSTRLQVIGNIAGAKL